MMVCFDKSPHLITVTLEYFAQIDDGTLAGESATEKRTDLLTNLTK